MSITINKNGKTFIVECIIFQDMSFENKLNDVTMEEEQIRLNASYPKLCTRIENSRKQYSGISGNHRQQRSHPHDKINVFLERCYAQSNRLSRLLARHLGATPHGRSSQHDRYGKVDTASGHPYRQ